MSRADAGLEGTGVRKNLRGRGRGHRPREESLAQRQSSEKVNTQVKKNLDERDLRAKNGEEMREMLQRQQRLLENRLFISKLPDKGKRISEFAEKLKDAIAEQEELKRTTEQLSAFRIDFQERLHINKGKEQSEVLEDHTQPILVPTSSISNSKGSEGNFGITENQNVKDAAGSLSSTLLGDFKHTDGTEMKSVTDKVKDSDMTESSSEYPTDEHGSINAKSMNGIQCASGDVDAWHVNADMLISGIQQVTITDKLDDNETQRLKQDNVTLKKTVPFLNDMHKKLHYIEVLENRAEHPVPARQKFRPNQMPAGSNESSRSSSPCQSPARIGPSLSAEEKHMRAKHRGDFTSARVPALHNMPAQLLPIEESVTLQMVQKHNYEEMQAKLAAQKLAERLNIKMVKYNPDDGASMKYREVRDEDYYSEDES